MSQSIFGGGTSYNEQSLIDIRSDIINWIKYTKLIKAEMHCRLNEAQESGYWDHVGFDFHTTIHCSISYFQTIIDDLNIIINAIDNNTITTREITLLRKIGQTATNYNINEYPKSFKGRGNYTWHDHGNPDFKNIENMYAHGRDFFVTLQDAQNASSRMEDYMNTQNTINNTLNISGNVTNSQVQQGTVNSSQSQNFYPNTFDYSKALEILTEIKKHTSNDLFVENFGANANQIKESIDEAILLAEEQKDSTKLENILQFIKNTSFSVSTGLIANVIFLLLQNGFPAL